MHLKRLLALTIISSSAFTVIRLHSDTPNRIDRLEPYKKYISTSSDPSDPQKNQEAGAQNSSTNDFGQPQKSRSVSTYDSLTEEKGTFALIAEEAQQQAAKKEAAKKALQKPTEQTPQTPTNTSPHEEGTIINFSNVSITEVVRYVSRITGRNFIYDPQELQFNVTIQSEAPTTIEEVMVMLLQNLRIHGFALVEEGPNFLIHLNPQIRGVPSLYDGPANSTEPQIVTQVFLLQNVSAEKCGALIKMMLSDNASIEVIDESKLIVTDLVSNIARLAEIIQKLDTQTSGLEVGQYVSLNTPPNVLISTAQQLLSPMAVTKPLVMVPHSPSNSIFIVTTPFLLEKALSILQTIDLGKAKSGLLSDVKFNPKESEDAAERARMKAELLRGGGLNKAQIDSLSDNEIRDLLKKRLFSETEINQLTTRDAKNLLWTDINNPGAANERMSLQRQQLSGSSLPGGQQDSTQFLILKLHYRKSSDVSTALRSIAASLAEPTRGPEGHRDVILNDLIQTLNSLQSVDDNNTLVFTGTQVSIDKVKELVSQIDTPVRQVLIEALVLDTTLDNSLEFGVEWSGRIQRTNFGAQVGFVRSVSSNFAPVFNAVGEFTPPQIVPPTDTGFALSSIGRKIKFRGRGFRSTGALIHAISIDKEDHVIMNPKITTEHNVPAEVFVGEQIPIKGQSIVNATGVGATNVVSNNYETREVGVLLKVTPLISSGDTVTLIIEQKVSSASAAQVAAQGNQNAPPATTKEARTVTRVHMPSDHFFIMSGLITEEKELDYERMPCLGALPVIGSLFGVKTGINQKRNFLIFIRPIIIDTPNDIDEITKRQEEIFKAKSKTERGWRKELKDVGQMANFGNWFGDF